MIMLRAKFQFSEKSIDTLSSMDNKPKYFSDTIVPKLKLCIYPSNRKSYLLEIHNGKTRIKLGDHGKLKAVNARKIAKAILSKDPRSFQGLDRDNNRGVSKLTIGEFIAIYRETQSKSWAEKTVKRFDSHCALYIVPNFGSKFLDEITSTDVLTVFNKLTIRAPISANVMKQYLQAILTAARHWGFLSFDFESPCRNIQSNPYTQKGRALNANDIRRLFIITQEECKKRSDIYNLINLLALTGCRYEEIASLKWDFCYPNHFRLPTTKTGKRIIYFDSEVKKILDDQAKVRRNEFVFPAARKTNSQIAHIARHWDKIRKRLGYDTFRLHDLRHTFATQALIAGIPFGHVSKLLGHKNPSATEIYAHSTIDMVRGPTEQITDLLMKNMGLRGFVCKNLAPLTPEEESEDAAQQEFEKAQAKKIEKEEKEQETKRKKQRKKKKKLLTGRIKGFVPLAAPRPKK